VSTVLPPASGSLQSVGSQKSVRSASIAATASSALLLMSSVTAYALACAEGEVASEALYTYIYIQYLHELYNIDLDKYRHR